jgi:hypothetical protein
MQKKEYYDEVWKLANEVIKNMSGGKNGITEEMALDALTLAYIGLLRSHPHLIQFAKMQMEKALEFCCQESTYKGAHQESMPN